MFCNKATLIAVLVAISVDLVSAQKIVTVDEVIILARDTSFQLRADSLQIEADRLLERKATHIPDP